MVWNKLLNDINSPTKWKCHNITRTNLARFYTVWYVSRFTTATKKNDSHRRCDHHFLARFLTKSGRGHSRGVMCSDYYSKVGNVSATLSFYPPLDIRYRFQKIHVCTSVGLRSSMCTKFRHEYALPARPRKIDEAEWGTTNHVEKRNMFYIP